MRTKDPFAPIARYYDPIMEHVDYERWFNVATALAELLPQDFAHLDAACGTGHLLGMLQKIGWRSHGVDLSFSMLQTGKRRRQGIPLATADLRALPFNEHFELITCLFDSLNFLLKEADLQETFHQLHQALHPEGILYFDVVTERMVTEHFEDQSWTESTGGFHTTWKGSYDRKSAIADTEVRVNTGGVALIRERIYAREVIEAMLAKAGFNLLGVVDANSWRAPGKRSTRLDFVVSKSDSCFLRRQFKHTADHLKTLLA